MAAQEHTRGYIKLRDPIKAYNWLRHIETNAVERGHREDNQDQLGQEMDRVPQRDTRGQSQIAVATRHRTETLATPHRIE